MGKKQRHRWGTEAREDVKNTEQPLRNALMQRKLERDAQQGREGVGVEVALTPRGLAMPRRNSMWAPSNWRVRSPTHKK